MSRKTRARWARNIRPLFTVYLPVLPYVLFALFPLYFMLVTSLKSNAELYVINTVRSGSRAGSPPTIMRSDRRIRLSGAGFPTT